LVSKPILSYLFVYDFLKDAAGNSDYLGVGWSDTMTSALQIGKLWKNATVAKLLHSLEQTEEKQTQSR
jgi:hypothetical protein